MRSNQLLIDSSVAGNESTISSLSPQFRDVSPTCTGVGGIRGNDRLRDIVVEMLENSPSDALK